MSLGVVISAPAVVLSVVLGLSVTQTVLITALPTVVYTMFGGVQAVAWTDVKQMVLIVVGLIAAVVVLVIGLPADVGVVDALTARRFDRPDADVRFHVRHHQPVHVLVGDDRRASSCSAPTSAPTRARCSAISPHRRWTRRAPRC